MISACGNMDAAVEGHGGEKMLWFIVASRAKDRKAIRR